MSARCAAARTEKDPGFFASLRMKQNEGRPGNQNRGRATPRSSSRPAIFAERAATTARRTRVNTLGGRANPPCHSERSEESRVPCGDQHPQPWSDRFVRVPGFSAHRRMSAGCALARTEKDPGLFASLRMTQNEGRPGNQNRGRATPRSSSRPAIFAERAATTARRARMNTLGGRANPPCHSERSEESRVPCGDEHLQPWSDRFVRIPGSANRRMSARCAAARTEKDPGFFASLRMTQKKRERVQTPNNRVARR